MTTAVTGATGQLGRLVIADLLRRGVAAGEIVAVVRDSARATDLADVGVDVRVAHYSDPAALRTALTGVDKLLLVSGSEVGQRVAQHTNVIEAAEANGVALIAYTSLLKADTSGVSLAPEHLATEQRLAASAVPSVLLRNGIYWETYLSGARQTIESGILYGAAGEGRIAGAARSDFADAAAAVLTSGDHSGRIYELGGDERSTHTELAAAIGETAGKDVAYEDLSEADYASALVGAGLPEPVATMIADIDSGIARGDVDTESGDLQKLIGRASTPVADVVRAVIA